MATVRLIGPTQRAYAKELIDKAPQGWVMKVGEETRRDRQNRLMWPLIEDLRQQLPDMRVFSKDQVKLRFLDALGEEMAYLPKLEGAGFFPVGQHSSTLTVEQFAALIELIKKYGAERGVVFRDELALESLLKTERKM